MYSWLVRVELPQRKMAGLRGVSLAPGADLFETLAGWFGAGLQFFVRELRLAQLATSLMDPTAEPEIRELHREVEQQSHVFLRAMVVEAMDRGEVRPDLDPDLVTMLLSKVMGGGLSDTLLLRMGLHVVSFADEPSQLATVPQRELTDLECEPTDMLRRAVGTG
ncbi:MAG: hypothetical protein ACI9MC_003444 [Kiritimatiellia bacterium]|jgi:hypothetical protein